MRAISAVLGLLVLGSAGVLSRPQDIIDEIFECECVPEERCITDLLYHVTDGDNHTIDIKSGDVPFVYYDDEVVDGSGACEGNGTVCCQADHILPVIDEVEVDDDDDDDPGYGQCSSFPDYACAPYSSCPPGDLAADAQYLITIRSGVVRSPALASCPDENDVCCRLGPDGELPQLNEPDYQPRCGRRNRLPDLDVAVDPRSGFLGNLTASSPVELQSSATEFGEWPHMCAVHRKSGGQHGVDLKVYECGASLLAPGVVLTAAHCVDDLPDLKVRCGDWQVQEVSEPRPHQDRLIRRVTIHPEFDKSSLHHDLAVLHLERPFNLRPHVDTICLPEKGEAFEREGCVATGWGKDKFGDEGHYQNELKQVEIPLVDRRACERTLRTTRLGRGYRLHESFLCAGGLRGQDTCEGDGGGPLVCPRAGDPDTYVQVGVIAWGIGCGDEIPGAYASVQYGRCFIKWAARCFGHEADGFVDDADDCGGADAFPAADLKRLGAKRQKLMNILPLYSLRPKQKGALLEALRKTEQLIRKYEELIGQCQVAAFEWN